MLFSAIDWCASLIVHFLAGQEPDATIILSFIGILSVSTMAICMASFYGIFGVKPLGMNWKFLISGLVGLMFFLFGMAVLDRTLGSVDDCIQVQGSVKYDVTTLHKSSGGSLTQGFEQDVKVQLCRTRKFEGEFGPYQYIMVVNPRR